MCRWDTVEEVVEAKHTVVVGRFGRMWMGFNDSDFFSREISTRDVLHWQGIPKSSRFVMPVIG